MSISKDNLRIELRTARRSVSTAEQLTASEQLCTRCCQTNFYKSAKKIALYWPNDHEINCHPIINFVLQDKKQCYLPVLELGNRQTLAFATYDLHTPMVANRYGILEPDLSYAMVIDSCDLDIIFVPLVGFDNKGSRLGRGGGYYDAAVADLHRLQRKKLPKIIGLAYECQRVSAIPTDSWDWQLDAVITENNIYEFQNNPAA